MILIDDMELRVQRFGGGANTTLDTTRGDVDPVSALYAAARRAAEDGSGGFIEDARLRAWPRRRSRARSS